MLLLLIIFFLSLPIHAMDPYKSFKDPSSSLRGSHSAQFRRKKKEPKKKKIKKKKKKYQSPLGRLHLPEKSADDGSLSESELKNPDSPTKKFLGLASPRKLVKSFSSRRVDEALREKLPSEEQGASDGSVSSLRVESNPIMIFISKEILINKYGDVCDPEVIKAVHWAYANRSYVCLDEILEDKDCNECVLAQINFMSFMYKTEIEKRHAEVQTIIKQGSKSFEIVDLETQFLRWLKIEKDERRKKEAIKELEFFL